MTNIATAAARPEPAHAHGGHDDETRTAQAVATDAAADPGAQPAPRRNRALNDAQEDESTHGSTSNQESNRAATPQRAAEADPDASLIARVGARDAGAVRSLVVNKLPRLLALATRMLGDRMEAEDVAQEAFMRIWKQAPHWRTGEAKFDTWLHRVALNLCYDRLRGHRETPAPDADALSEQADPAARPDERLESRARDARVRDALAALPVRQREALVLTYYQELSNAEAAALMDITVDALESLLARARRTLRAQLAGEGPAKDRA
ncbi:MAG TPA: RNA polymerase sigma factor [Paraburkholderia sp.]|uniref:RNA polymerase sigma factor n=1 Tax=Paraburkholderia sp. TaxID=1926495 RepID=UPI002DEE2284|nr:RNA polymerase sigma factor [Paraburkholderia sp.]